ncbi:hypothetical protein HS1genome_0500 [Sulfodiicoccus acidiphilus]|uniref:D-aminoacyl-tRNA deacylase n=1 Tax=Sulfodiicoccus acidiphilus TaxID=1670455 RepID=A0A348B1Q9_9CREN|nr:D-aminoacyl-tRNA deacylase [Sulfodiicoccus acidiphilus]BBD72111.1 hypothetical protein HS1genome_0500 [Sulfodiicoccus acidiphilus]GGT94895.1 hypothetical protein GCM10007116_10640 [Sulfodiicoccus acidiphilus]
MVVVRILYSSKDPVGQTIKQLGYGFEDVETEVVDFTYRGTDPAVMICRHYSKSGIPTFTVHHPGNPTAVSSGGEPLKLGVAYPRLAFTVLANLRGADLPASYEATHHGPTLDSPLVFVELGSREEVWRNAKYVKFLVDAVESAVDSYTEIQCTKAAGIGGGHYAPSFTRMETHCFGHIISRHQLPEVSDVILREAMTKSAEPLDEVVLDDLNFATKRRVSSLASELGLRVKLRQHAWK